MFGFLCSNLQTRTFKATTVVQEPDERVVFRKIVTNVCAQPWPRAHIRNDFQCFLSWLVRLFEA